MREGGLGLPKPVLRICNQLGRDRWNQQKVRTLSGLSASIHKSRPDASEGCSTISSIGFDRVKTVSKLGAVERLGLASSEKQIPQIVENTKKCGELKEPLELDGMRPRQVRYQAALRPDLVYFSF